MDQFQVSSDWLLSGYKCFRLMTDQSGTLYGFLLSYVISLEFFVSSLDHLLTIAE